MDPSHDEITPPRPLEEEDTDEVVVEPQTVEKTKKTSGPKGSPWMAWLIKHRKAVCLVYVLLGALYLWQVFQKPAIAKPYLIEIEKFQF
jgi:hypothetical protein